jgi:hypothetical protein
LSCQVSSSPVFPHVLSCLVLLPLVFSESCPTVSPHVFSCLVCCVTYLCPFLSCFVVFCFFVRLSGFSLFAYLLVLVLLFLFLMASLCALYNNKSNNKNTAQCKTENSQAAFEQGRCCVVLSCVRSCVMLLCLVFGLVFSFVLLSCVMLSCVLLCCAV